MVGKLIAKILPKFKQVRVQQAPEVTTNQMSSNFLNESYAQEGEDLVLDRFLNQKNNGFYIDVGAHHPMRFSNTYRFYKRGWSGINIDAMPGSMNAFENVRSRDINLEIGISKHKGLLEYYIFNEPALNTFSKTEAEIKNKIAHYHIEKVISVQTKPLKEILREHLSDHQKIDFMSIDVEGMDEEVLRTNNWKKYRPTYLLVEAIGKPSLESYISSNSMHSYLKELGYHLIAKTFNTLFYKDSNE